MDAVFWSIVARIGKVKQELKTDVPKNAFSRCQRNASQKSKDGTKKLDIWGLVTLHRPRFDVEIEAHEEVMEWYESVNQNKTE